MTRKQLVNGLRALHEDDIIDGIRFVKRTGAFYVNFTSIVKGLGLSSPGMLVIADPYYATKQRLQTKPK